MAETAGFLTDEQRKLMKSASLTRESSAELLSPRAASGKHHERKSHSGKNGRPKKGGSGGKGTWGSVMEDGSKRVLIDRNDPNYDSGEEPYHLIGAHVAQSLQVYKEKVVYIVEEYFATGNVADAATDLRDLGSPSYHHYFVKRLISMALDRHDREKEMASVLLSALYADVMEPDQLAKGFTKLLESADDLALDIPDATDVLALFLARAVVDDILPPAFLSKTQAVLPDGSKGLEVLQNAEKSYLNAPLHAEVVERRWGGSTQTTVEEVKRKITDLLKEYVESGDQAEARRCIRELNVPFFHHEVVKKALTLVIEKKSAEAGIVSLLQECADEGLISSNQMSKGFSRVFDALEDLSLDVPQAREILEDLAAKAMSAGWLSSSFVTPAAASAAAAAAAASNDDGAAANGDTAVDDAHVFKQKATGIIQEYFLSDDIAEVVRSLEDLAAPDFNAVFVKKLITLAMDRKNREKEMASVLLSALYAEVIPVGQIGKAFTMLLESAEDTALDIPDAANQLAYFLDRAVVDDILPPLYLEEINEQLPEGSLGKEIVHSAESILAARHAGERILRCWGGGTGRAVLDDAKDKIAKLLEEFESGGDMGEACQCVRDLAMPYFHHEVVKRALVMAMERKSARPLCFLRECSSEGLITTSQMVKGFGRVADYIDDLALDIPDAKSKFQGFVDEAKAQGWLSSAFGGAAQANGSA
ncbi:programmed cell death protein 4 [Selaginella moellendorffii]|nr:programmed cell death protein 4 [Selaginella moellendorffii]|eukprot:XP_002964316.2 programmed cell death protein 4 [Selaginella moellendorffii]